MPYSYNPLPWKFDKTATVASGGGVTQVDSEDGNATPIAGVIILSADDTTDNDTDGIRTVAGGQGDPATASNEIRIEITNRLQGTGTSTNGSTEDLITFELADNSVYRFRFLLAGRSTAGNFVGQGMGYSIEGSARRSGGGAALISTPFQDADENASIAGSTNALVVSGNNVILQVTGIADETIIYNAVGEYVVV